MIFTFACGDESTNLVPSDNQNITYRETHIRGRIHRAKEVTNSGKTCGCEACFGLCQFVITDEEPAGTKEIRIIKHGGNTYVYLLESSPDAETDFVVDYDLNVYVDEGGTSLVARILVAGTYTFESPGSYTNPSGVTTSYGRAQVVTQ